MPFKSKDGRIEHMWVQIKESAEDQNSFKGILNNDPIVCTHLKDGDEVELKRTEIEQWMK